MPLNPATLTAAVLRVTDQGDPGFVGFPATAALSVDNWAGVARAFFAEMVMPPPTGLAAGEAAFKAAMSPQVAVDALGALAAGFGAFALALAGAAVPPAVPPPAPLVLTPGPPTPTPAVPAAALAATVFTWAKTGMWIVPPAPPVPWS